MKFLVVALISIQLCINASAQVSQQDTIQRCLIELRSTDPHIRQRALLLLGKFDNTLVLKASEDALADPNDKVRQTAVVNLSSPMLSNRIKNPNAVLRLLQDENLHTRRLVASNLLRPLIFRITLEKHSAKSNAAKFISSALHDPDDKLRLILLDNFYSLKSIVSEKAFLHLCSDPNSMIQIKALEYLKRSISDDQLIKAAEVLHKHPDKRIRMRLVQTISRKTVARPILKKMISDPDSEISLLAKLSLGARDNVTAIIDTITTSRVSPELMQQAFRIIFPHPQGKIFTETSLSSTNESLRYYALLTLIRYRKTPTRPQLFTLIHDSSSRIRELTITEINLLEMTNAELTQLTESDYSDVHALSLNHISQLKSLGSLRESLIGFLLNDTIKTRQGALILLWHFKDEERYDFIEQGLSDESPDIRKIARDLLNFDKSPQAQKILLDNQAQP